VGIRELRWDAMNWIDLLEDRDKWRALVNMVMNPHVPKIVGKFLSSCTTSGFSRSSLNSMKLVLGATKYFSVKRDF
jgi:hypothetical protein